MQKIKIAKPVTDIKQSVIREMSAMSAQFPEAINLSIGEPDFDTPAEITEKAFADARNGHTHYTPSRGDAALVSLLAAAASKETGMALDESNLLVVHGGMGGLSAALRTLVETGDEVLLLAPYFPSYRAQVGLAGGTPVEISTRLEDGFLPLPSDIENAITPRSRVLILNSPNNPTGAVMDEEILAEIARIAVRHNLFVISDEVYDRIVSDKPFASIYTRPEMAERCLVIRSFSKTYAMTGWRTGYCYGPAEIITNIMKVANYYTACTCSVSQRAAVAALNLDDAVIEKITHRFAERVRLVCRRLEKMPGIGFLKPSGSFYVFVDIRKICKDSKQFAIDLLQGQQVVVVPGYAFGACGEGFVRIACTVSRQKLDTAMDRFEAFVSEYKGKA